MPRIVPISIALNVAKKIAAVYSPFETLLLYKRIDEQAMPVLPPTERVARMWDEMKWIMDIISDLKVHDALNLRAIDAARSRCRMSRRRSRCGKT